MGVEHRVHAQRLESVGKERGVHLAAAKAALQVDLMTDRRHA
jgi:hypothetical protein